MMTTFKARALPLAVMMAAGTAVPVANANVALEEVVVTAQKREQSLQDTPIALTAFDASALENYGVSDVSDVGLFTPNVNIAKSPGGSSGATVSVRGSVTVNPSITWEPTVGIYLDGIFLGKNIGGIFDIAELERVEVLRGPQGTLYGKNTVGGAINLITRKPGEEFGGKVRATVGNYDLYEGYVSVDTGELGSSGVKANLSYLKTKRDGFYDNVDTDPFGGFNPLVSPASTKEFTNLDDEVYRVDVVWDATDTFSARYVYDYSDRDNEPTMGQLTEVYPDAIQAFENNLALAGAVGPNPGQIPTGFIPALGSMLEQYKGDINKRPDEIGNDFAGYETSETSGHALTLEYDFGPLVLKYVGSYRELEYKDQIDIDGSTIDLFHSGRDLEYEQISHEIQVVGKSDNLDYVAGIYYFEEEADVFNPISFFNLGGAFFPTSNNEYGLDNSSVAAFGQVDWRPTDRLSLSLGIRWTEEERDQYILTPGVIPYTEAKDDWSNVSGTLIAAYDITDEVNIYAKVAEGWKSGGFNGEASTQADFLESYDPEEVLSYEVGVKSRLLDNRLQLNAAVFQNNIKDMQFSIFDGQNSNVSNAGEATVTGFELEAMGQVTEDLRLTLAYGYMDSSYDEFIEGGVDVKDQKDFQFAPRHTASFAVDYTIASGDWGVVDFHADWSFKDEQNPYTDPSQNAGTKVDDYQVVNARLTVSEIRMGSSDNTLKVALWGKNLADEEYNTHGIPFGMWDVNYYGDPRTYGIDATFEF